MKKIDPRDINENAIKLISEEWMLISAGDETSFNMMTASWGFLGEMWGGPAAVCAIRPQRYTYKFVKEKELFTLSFYGERRDIHKICGSRSGRDCDKAALSGLTPLFIDGTVTFREARLTLVCRKRYDGQLDPSGFPAGDCASLYPENDRHHMIIGEIIAAYANE